MPEILMVHNAIIFDLDGTLLNTLDDLGNAMNRVLEQEHFPTHPIDAYRYFVGDGAAMLVRRALPETDRDDETIQRCLMLFREDYRQHWDINTRPYPGIQAMLDALTTRGARMAVLSNKPDADAKRCVAELLPDWSFELVLGQREGIPRKPDPAGALEIARHFQVPTSGVLYLGDTSVDMRTAIAARMFPVGVLWGFRTREELLQNGAQIVLHQPMDIFTVLNGANATQS